MWIDVLVALAVVASVGLLFGVLLALIVHLFGTEEDEMTKRVRAVLPGINCGACGFKGCNDYAEAVASGKAKPNLCIPGAEDAAKTLGEILGVDVEEPTDLVAFVHCNGTCDATTEKAVYDGVASCKARSAMFGGTKSCTYGCVGCGDCAKVCPSQAIRVMNGVAIVNTARCLGCGLCTKECPKNLISMVPQEAAAAVFCRNKDKGAEAKKSCQNACIGCKMCEKACPAGAVRVINNCAEIDYAICTGCGLCAEKCPTKSIRRVHFPDLPEGFCWK